MRNALYQALLSLWEGSEPNYEEVLGREGSEEEVRELISSLWVKCYPEGDKRLCVYSYKRIPKEPVPLLLDARGTVIAWSKDGPELVAYPFHKFFNVGEIDYPKGKPLKAFEKLDGTMISAFWFEGRLRTATRKRLDADSPFAQKALELLKDFDPRDYTYVFELLGPGCGSPWVGNQEVLKKEGDWKIVPLAKRDMKSLKLWPLEGPREFEVKSWEEAEEVAASEGIEGLVLWYEVGEVRPKMYKVKSKDYLKLTSLLQLGYEGLAKIITIGKLDDVIKLLDPEVARRAKQVSERLDEIAREVKRGSLDDPEVKEWLLIDPQRAIEVAIIKALRGEL